jgi:hypothetical protein
MKESEKVDMIGLHWALSFQSLAIADLAAALARIDRGAAEQMIAAIENKIVTDLGAQRDEFRKQGWSVRPLGEIAANLRETIMAAKKAIADATKPN